MSEKFEESQIILEVPDHIADKINSYIDETGEEEDLEI